MISYEFLSCLKPTGTNSFRLSATKLYNDLGGNAQNQDKSTLDIYRARKGYIINQRDQSGAEALVVAYLSRPGRYRDLFRVGIKPHTYLATNLFSDQFVGELVKSLVALEPTDMAKHADWQEVKDLVEKASIWYDLAKRICHGASYKMGPRTFQQNVLKESFGLLRLSIAQCKDYLDYFYKLFPEIRLWQDEVVARAKKERILYNLLGSPRVFGRNFDESYEREIISWIPQSTVGEITHEAVAEVMQYIDGQDKDWNVVSNKHDSFAVESPVEESDECLRVMGASMAVKMIGFEGVEFVMKCDAQRGYNMGKFHKDKNPSGMDKVKI